MTPRATRREEHVQTETVGSTCEQRASLLGARTLLGAPGLTTRSKKLLRAKGIATSSVLVPSSDARSP